MYNKLRIIIFIISMKKILTKCIVFVYFITPGKLKLSDWNPDLWIEKVVAICTGGPRQGIFRILLGGTAQRDFRPTVFLIIRTSLGHWPMGYNFFDELFQFLGDILRWVNLPACIIWPFRILFKETLQRDCRPIFHYSCLPEPLSNGLKYFG